MQNTKRIKSKGGGGGKEEGDFKNKKKKKKTDGLKLQDNYSGLSSSLG